LVLIAGVRCKTPIYQNFIFFVQLNQANRFRMGSKNDSIPSLNEKCEGDLSQFIQVAFVISIDGSFLMIN